MMGTNIEFSGTISIRPVSVISVGVYSSAAPGTIRKVAT